MQTKIIPRVPETECYICGSKTVTALCHHCGRAMCTQHDSSKLAQKYPYLFRLVDREFTGLNLQEAAGHEIGVHCKCCNHYTALYEPLLVMSVGLGLGLIVWSIYGIASNWLAVFLSLLGLLIIIPSVRAFYKYRQLCPSERWPYDPSLPVLGKFPAITVNEFVTGKITLSPDGIYAVSQMKAKGILRFSLQLTDQDRERLDKYRQKYPWSRRNNTHFHAGFAVLTETNEIYAGDGKTRPINPLTFLDYVHNQPFFDHQSNGTIYDRQWESSQEYDLFWDTSAASLPVQIVPTLLSEGEEWALELFVQVNPKQDMPTLSLPRIEEMTLEIPEDLGAVESHTPPARISDGVRRRRRSVTWKAIDLMQSQPIPPHATLYVRFANSANTMAWGKVTGHLRMRFEGALSGLEDVSLFSPLGHQRVEEEATTIKQTIVKVAFEFRLEGLCLRKFYPSTDSVEQLTTIPESKVIARLVNAMSDNKMYVQRVIENPPRMNRANAQIMNRLWVIAGRRYNQATPIDFRIVAVGQEQYENSDKPFDGNTRFEINVQGTVIEDWMKIDIDALRDEIVDIIQCVPELEIELCKSDLCVKKWGKVTGTIINTGKSIVKNISISVLGMKVAKIETIEDLLPEEERVFEISVYAEEKGEVPITISADCRDRYGQLPSRKFRFQVFVREQPGTPTIGHQTNLYGPATGNFHTGSGDIEKR